MMDRLKNIKTHPCCGFFLHGGTRVVALIDVGISLFSLVLFVSEMYQKFGILQMLKENNEFFKYYFRAFSWVCYIVSKLIILALSVLLFKAAKKRSARLCKVWLVLSILTFVIMFTVFYINCALFNISIVVHAFGSAFVIYKMYSVYVVWVFVKEVQSYGGFNAALSGLTDAEVEEFEKGSPPEYAMEVVGLNVQNQGFNKDFEILPDMLEINESSILGSGAFGCVYRGKLVTDAGKTSVAVKTVNPNADVAYFKTLLSELKVMTFLSPHENVVNLLGACTAEIKRKKLYMVVEFCPFGNLFEYLKARRGLFVNFVKNGEITDEFRSAGKYVYTNINAGNTVTTLDLFKWVHQASKGLEFLEGKNVIHGDIAARNILLAYGKVAKISDFGLSKKLYQYTTIVKEDTLLPWRWMALESLRDMQFSIKSDVWAFATTIWETFSLAEIPFPGFTWDKDFINKLDDGLRMKQPRNATNEIYDLMLKCWEPNPENRPTFKEIRERVEEFCNNVEKIVGVEAAADTKDITEPPEDFVKSKVSEADEVEVYIPNQIV